MFCRDKLLQRISMLKTVVITNISSDRKRSNKKKGKSETRLPKIGGDGGIRTLDLTDANRTLSQLSYAPGCCSC